MACVNRTCDTFPESSLLYKLLVELFGNHYRGRTIQDDDDLHSLPPLFLAGVMARQAEILKHKDREPRHDDLPWETVLVVYNACRCREQIDVLAEETST